MGLMVISSNHKSSRSIKLFLKKYFSDKKSKILYLSLADEINKENYNNAQLFFKSIGLTTNSCIKLSDLQTAKAQKDILKASCIYLSYVNVSDVNKQIDEISSIVEDYAADENKIIILEGDACGLLGKNAEISNKVIFENSSEPINKTIGVVESNVISNWAEHKDKLCYLLDVSRTNNNKCYALSDGNAITKVNGKVEFHGDILEIENGNIRMFKGL